MKRMLQAFKGGVPPGFPAEGAELASGKQPLAGLPSRHQKTLPQITDLRRIRALFWPAGTGISPRGYVT